MHMQKLLDERKPHTWLIFVGTYPWFVPHSPVFEIYQKIEMSTSSSAHEKVLNHFVLGELKRIL